MQNSVIITAGGVGKRMLANQPKQFIVLRDRPIMMHTIEKFYAFDKTIEIIVVLPENQMKTWMELCEEYNFSIVHQVVKGGEERFHSVKNGLKKVTGEFIAVHDAVRPLVNIDVIRNCFKSVVENNAVVPVVGLKQSIRKVDGNTSVSEDRSKFRLVQTPQCFSASVLNEAYDVSYVSTFTDDASVVEMTGQKIMLIEGNEENIKLTTPFDLRIADLFFDS